MGTNKLAFLHTSSTHVERFTNLVRKYDSKIEIEHLVAEELLETALNSGKIDKSGFAKSVEQIRKNQPDLIICTCSSYGDFCEEFEDVMRIDMPIADYIVENFSVIILAYTVTSTRAVSRRLLKNVAKNKGKKIKIVDCDCTDSWQYFLLNEVENYNKEIFGKVNEIYTKGDAVFLAQASMEGAIKYFEGGDVEIFSSGEFGVKKYLGL